MIGDDELRAHLRAFIRERYLPLRRGAADELSDTEDLAALGVLDSLAVVELVEELERRYGIAVRDADITPEHLGSIAAIARYVGGRRAA